MHLLSLITISTIFIFLSKQNEIKECDLGMEFDKIESNTTL